MRKLVAVMAVMGVAASFPPVRSDEFGPWSADLHHPVISQSPDEAQPTPLPKQTARAITESFATVATSSRVSTSQILT